MSINLSASSKSSVAQLVHGFAHLPESLRAHFVSPVALFLEVGADNEGVGGGKIARVLRRDSRTDDDRDVVGTRRRLFAVRGIQIWQVTNS